MGKGVKDYKKLIIAARQTKSNPAVDVTIISLEVLEALELAKTCLVVVCNCSKCYCSSSSSCYRPGLSSYFIRHPPIIVALSSALSLNLVVVFVIFVA
jgi:hypothetical protein